MANPRTAQAALDRASEENLLLVYQPIHEARTRAVYAAEALLRQRRQSGEIREATIITTAAEAGPELFALDWWGFTGRTGMPRTGRATAHRKCG